MKRSQTGRSLPVGKRPLIELLSELRRLGVKLFADGERMRSQGPQGVLTPALRQEISARKGEILAFLQKSQAPQKEPIRPRSAGEDHIDHIPLSFAQQRLWFLEQLEDDAERAPYNEVNAVQIRGTLDLARLERCIREIAKRHEILRTTFQAVNGVPHQVIAPTASLTIDSHIVRSDADDEAEVLRLARQETLEPFDLATGPLLRVKVIQFTPHTSRHVLLLTMPHIIGDAWSASIFSQEFVALYDALLPHVTKSPLPPLPIQYADFAIWQRNYLDPKGEIQPKLLAYWTKQLEDAPPLLELPTDHPRPPRQSYRGESYAYALPKGLSEGLQALSVKSGTTLFMTLLAAFKVLLMRYSGQQDILVGTPTTNRNREELESLIGLFVNTLALRTDLSGNPTFSDLLERVRQVMLGAYQHKDLPFAQLMETLPLERTLSYNPLIQVMFALRNIPQAPPAVLSGLTLTPLELPAQTAKFDLTLEIEEKAEGLYGRWEYNRDLFEPTTIERMATHWKLLLEAIVANPVQPIEQLPLLTEAERHQLLVEWNDTQADYPTEKCIHQLFEEQVQRTPDRIAVVFAPTHDKDQHLTYRELNRRANQLAHYLIREGVGPEVLVGICLTRSIEMMVSLLGVLKAGGAYVPLDPSFPQERLAFMVADSQVRILLTTDALLGSIPYEGPQLALDSQWHLLESRSQDNPSSEVQPENLAYCIYTSGSTGKPKGVLLCHRSLTNFLYSMRTAPGLTNQDTLLAVTTISFDIAGLELYLPLLVGAKLVLAEQELLSDGRQLLRKLITSGATVMQATPATWRMLLASGWAHSQAWRNRPASLGPLKVLSGGEALPCQLAHQLLALGVDLWNMYGPTETTIWSAVAHITNNQSNKHADASKGVITIGRPIANTQIYILDKHLQPVPIGVPGELHIGGDGVARGYLNRPKLTNERFIPNPFREGRLYKTGDLCRYLQSGKLEFLGRLDHQIKIRGFRVELGEIEAVLIEHELIREVVVVAQNTDADGPSSVAERLVAYFVPAVPASDLSPQVSDALTHRNLRLYLKDTLPDYMIPALFVPLSALPLTPNGKINRRALPAPDASSLARTTTFVAPRNETESILAAIWQELLRVKQASAEERGIGIHDNFFNLGGHSLLATQVISRIREAFEVKIPLRHLFESPTVANLAERIEDSRITKKLQTFSSSSIMTSDEREEFAL